jgi:hypothetical protein
MSYTVRIPRCTHIKTNGTQCGSPALRGRRFCFFHKNWRGQRIQLNAKPASNGTITLPVLEDADSIQVALMQVMRLILAGQIESKTAGLLLYGLQTASVNLRQMKLDPYMKEEIVVNPEWTRVTSLGERAWSEADFEEQEEEDDEDSDDNDQSDTEDNSDQKNAAEAEQVGDIKANVDPRARNIAPDGPARTHPGFDLKGVAGPEKTSRDRRAGSITAWRVGVDSESNPRLRRRRRVPIAREKLRRIARLAGFSLRTREHSSSQALPTQSSQVPRSPEPPIFRRCLFPRTPRGQRRHG